MLTTHHKITTKKFVVGLFVICVVMALQLVFYRPVTSLHRDKEDGTQRRKSSSSNGDRSRIGTDHGSLNTTRWEGNFYYAPFIVGAGHGTTGTHLIAEVTCRLGFASAHYAMGCLPKSAVVLSPGHGNFCPRPIAEFRGNYTAFFRSHWALNRIWMLSKRDDLDPARIRNLLVDRLEKVILWGKENEVAIALHDTPYPMLMPQILKLVRKHYGAQARPIILLSEREPREYVKKRLKEHGSYSRLCRPIDSSSQIQPMNRTTLEGGLFDVIGCIDWALANRDNFTLPDILYSMKQADLANELELIAQTMDDYQHAMSAWEIFRYDMFHKGYRTEVEDLSGLVKDALISALVNADGALRMKAGKRFRGLELLGGERGKATGQDAQEDTLPLDEESMRALANYSYMVPINHRNKKLWDMQSGTKCGK